MKLLNTAIKDVLIFEPRVIGDDRGFFMETWRLNEFREATGDHTFVQDNHSKSVRHVLRGLHYQIGTPQGKLVRVIAGEVFDVAVDLRKSSPDFGRWTGTVLNTDNRHILWIPPGFAHGFYVLSPEAEFVYKCTDYYAPSDERTLKWDDPVIGVQWPIAPGEAPLISQKDENGTPFEDAEVFA